MVCLTATCMHNPEGSLVVESQPMTQMCFTFGSSRHVLLCYQPCSTLLQNGNSDGKQVPAWHPAP